MALTATTSTWRGAGLARQTPRSTYGARPQVTWVLGRRRIGGHTERVRARYWLRIFINIINLSTLLGLIAAVVGRARLTPGHHGLILGWGYRFPIPPRRTPAFTLGNVILLRHDGPEILQRRPRLLVHEERHSTQYAYCLGVVMVLLYLLAAAWSWLRTGDPASRNIFERIAGLADGGYKEHPVRPLFGRSRPRPRAEVGAAPEATATPEPTATPKATATPEATTAPEAPPAVDHLS